VKRERWTEEGGNLWQMKKAKRHDAFTSRASEKSLWKRAPTENARIVGNPFTIAENIEYTGDLVTASNLFVSLLDAM
jgi:hypothetical protein